MRDGLFPPVRSLLLPEPDGTLAAQRGNGLDRPLAQRLIRRSGTEAASVGGRIVCGAMTDQLEPDRTWTKADLARAYLEQAEWIQDSRAVLGQIDGPVFHGDTAGRPVPGE
ncbi:DUF993 family protein [Streptomyces shenzhenensis]|uniref:DUF993 family protein n=1 Tax=Streptomyces shenzhenensis TaxID=943815 RepID=UPI00340AB793